MDPSMQVGLARSAVLAVPRPDRATLVVTGKDRISWLNGLLTCNLAKASRGEAVYGLAVTRSGRVLADAVVLSEEDGARAFVVVPGRVVDAVRAHFEHYLVMEDAEMAPGSEAFQVWALHGPRSPEVVAAARAAGAVAGAVDRTGLGGGILLLPAPVASALRQSVESAIAAASGAVGDEAGWELLRLERAVARFGVDFDERTYPQEAALEKTAVSFDKGCYLGQEVVCTLQMRGRVKRKLVSLVVDSSEAPGTGAEVRDGAGAPVGEVTSAGVSPTLHKAVALAMVKRACAEVGHRVVVGGAQAEVVERPT